MFSMHDFSTPAVFFLGFGFFISRGAVKKKDFSPEKWVFRDFWVYSELSRRGLGLIRISWCVCSLCEGM